LQNLIWNKVLINLNLYCLSAQAREASVLSNQVFVQNGRKLLRIPDDIIQQKDKLSKLEKYNYCPIT
jgi:hypothetical protein